VLLAGGGVTGYKYLSQSHVHAPGSPRPRLSSAASAPRAPTFDSSLGNWQHIGTRAQDPQPLTLEQLFPPQFELNGSLDLRTATSLTKNCSLAVFGADLQAALQAGHCSQALRASYISGDNAMMGTVGIANLISSAAALEAGQKAGPKEIIAPLPTPNDDSIGVVQASVKGNYLILIWTEFTNLQSPSTSAQRQQLEQFGTNMLDGSANIDLSNRMVNLTTKTCGQTSASVIVCVVASRTLFQILPGTLATVTGAS